MSIHLSDEGGAPGATFRDVLAASDRPLDGIWIVSGSHVAAEIVAGSGIPWVLIDTEHAPNSLDGVLRQLQAVEAGGGGRAGGPTPMVRVAANDEVLLKQILDIGAQNILVPMVNSLDEVAYAVGAVRYPPEGRRGVGSALARSGRWGRIGDYLQRADDYVSLFVQIESKEAALMAVDIAGADGVDGIFLGPSDLAASMGLLGQQTHPDVGDVVTTVIRDVAAMGVPVGVNAFDPVVANHYRAAGASFVLVGADVSLMARGAEALADAWRGRARNG